MKSKISLLSVLSFVFLPILVVQAQDVDVPGNLTMVNSTATTGNILKGGVPFIHNFGFQNTFLGVNAGNLTMTGRNNTASGSFTLSSNTTGGFNTADGVLVLFRNTTGNFNAAIGQETLRDNTTGSFNTASGVGALQRNTTGSFNTASGEDALVSNTTANENTASGFQTLFSNTTGDGNTAVGTAALKSNTTGSRNIAIGASAGVNVLTGNDNIHIGNTGVDESNTIRIGNSAVHTSFFVAGVASTPVDGVPVLIDTNGQLGVAPSSRRFKDNVRDMDNATNGLRRLRPVTFYYKQAQAGGPRQLQYGLVAEEVAAVFPELVEYSKTGEPFAVRYHLLAPMLLNEVQKQDRKIEEQAAQIAELKGQLAEIAGRLNRLDHQAVVAATAAGPHPTQR